MSSAKKKVILRRLTGDILPGYLPLSGFTSERPGGRVADLLDLTGRLIEVPLNQIKMVCYVRDFNLADTVNPERLTRRAFLARPRSEGLWVKVTFRAAERASDSSQDGAPERVKETLEGLAAADLSLVDSLMEDGGLHFAPPDIRSNTQRIFVPRVSIETLQILAVITTSSKIKPPSDQTRERARKELQESLFDSLNPGSLRPN